MLLNHTFLKYHKYGFCVQCTLFVPSFITIIGNANSIIGNTGMKKINNSGKITREKNKNEPVTTNTLIKIFFISQLFN